MSKTKFMIFLSKSAPFFVLHLSEWHQYPASVASMLLSFLLIWESIWKLPPRSVSFSCKMSFNQSDSNISIDTTLICAAILFSLFYYSSSCFPRSIPSTHYSQSNMWHLPMKLASDFLLITGKITKILSFGVNRDCVSIISHFPSLSQNVKMAMSLLHTHSHKIFPSLLYRER